MESPEERPSVVCDDVRDIELRGLTTTAPASNEAVMELRDCVDAFLQGNRVVEKADSFVNVQGRSSQRIVLSGNELSRVKTLVCLSKDASASATTSH